jgi:chromosome segregation ATPase
MAKGITQEQVNTAVDGLVAAGERPTIERVRGVLGTGSPDTVTRMLDVWWRALGARLAQQHTKVAMPDAPADVSVAATQLWTVAIDMARKQIEGDVATERRELAQARETFTAEGVELQGQLDRQAAMVETANQARAAAETRLQDLQRLVDQQAALLADLQHRHDQAIAGQTALAEKLDAAHAALAIAQEKASSERVALESAHRTAEDRWLREVDRARQDETKLTTQLQQTERAGQAAAHKAAAQITELTNQLHQHERHSAAQAARLATLEGQLDRVHAQLAQRLARPARESAATVKKAGKAKKSTA